MRFRKMATKTGSDERGFSRPLFAVGLLGAVGLLAVGVFFAVRELTSDGDNAPVTATVGGDEQAGIDELLANKEAPQVAVADMGALPEGIAPPTLEQLSAGAGDNPELEQLRGECSGNSIVGGSEEEEEPLCADGLPFHQVDDPFRVCNIIDHPIFGPGASWPFSIGPNIVNRWPGYPTGETYTLGGTTTTKHSDQFFFFLPVIYWQDSGNWQSAQGEWFSSMTPFFAASVMRGEWFVWKDGRWQSGVEADANWKSDQYQVWGYPGSIPFPRSTIRNHPGREEYFYRYYFYWGPITFKPTGQTVFNGQWGHDDIGWWKCTRDTSGITFE